MDNTLDKISQFSVDNNTIPKYVMSDNGKLVNLLTTDIKTFKKLTSKSNLSVSEKIFLREYELINSNPTEYNKNVNYYFNEYTDNFEAKSNERIMKNFQVNLNAELIIQKKNIKQMKTLIYKEKEPIKEFEYKTIYMEIKDEIGLEDIFNQVSMTDDLYFCQYNSMYKLYSFTELLDSWLMKEQETIFIRTNMLYNIMFDSKKLNNDNYIVIQKKDDKLILSCRILTTFKNWENYIQNLFSFLNFGKFEEKEVDGYVRFILSDDFPSFNKYVLSELAMNHPIISKYFRIDESHAATKEKKYIWLLNSDKKTEQKSNIIFSTEFKQRAILFRIYRNSNIHDFDTTYIPNIKTLLNVYRNEYSQILDEYGNYADKQIMSMMSIEEPASKITRPDKPFRNFSFYTSNYTREQCPIFRIPKVVSDEEANKYDESKVLKFKGIDETNYKNYVCDHVENSFPKLQKNNMTNKDICQYVPCCFSKQESNTVTKTNKTNKLPKNITNIIQLFDNQSESFTSKTFGKSNISIITCIVNAISGFTSSFLISELKSHLIETRQTNPYGLTSLTHEKIKHNNCVSDKKLKIKEKDNNILLSYEIFGPILEELTNTRIIVFNADTFITPKIYFSLYNKKIVYPNCILMIQKQGGVDEYNYELILRNTTSSFPTQIIDRIYQQLSGIQKILDQNLYTIDLPTKKLISQSIDSVGKTRSFTYSFLDKYVTVYVSPTCQSYVKEINEPIKQELSLKRVQQFGREYGIDFTHKAVENNKIIALVSMKSTSFICVYCKTIDIDEIDLPELTNFTTVSVNSNLKTFQNLRKTKNIIFAYALKLFHTLNVDLDTFDLHHIVIDPSFKYVLPTTSLFTPVNFVISNKIIVHNNDIKKKLLYELELAIIQKVSIVSNGLFSYLSDFIHSKNQILYEGIGTTPNDQLVPTYYSYEPSNQIPVVINTTLLFQNSPFFWCHPMINKGNIYLLQIASSLNNAVHMSTVWNQKKYNPGMFTSDNVEITQQFTLYSYINKLSVLDTIVRGILSDGKSPTILSYFNEDKYVFFSMFNL